MDVGYLDPLPQPEVILGRSITRVAVFTPRVALVMLNESMTLITLLHDL
jgi:hypothetical protein